MSERLEAAARLLDEAAEQLDRAAAHCRTAAGHFRDREVTRPGRVPEAKPTK